MALTRIQSLGITDGTIVNADINASAAIAGTKLSGAGKVLQVITATDSTSRSTSSSSFVTASNTLSVTITPSSASNKIFIITNFIASMGSGEQSFFTIFRGATNLGHSTGGMIGGTIINSSAFNMPHSMSFLDSPSTTSATTYRVYFRTTGTVSIVLNSEVASITCFEIKG
jgi:hypothetical protein